MNPAILFVTADFPYANEAVSVFMAIQGAMVVRNGVNKKNTMNWFHVFMASMMASYAGAIFTKIFMGQPTSMLANDLSFGSCLVAFVIVNYSPLDIGYIIFSTFPGKLAYTVFAQLFRAKGLTLFSDVGFNVFKNQPSEYYPIPVFGPILFPSVLGNMGGFFTKGFNGHLEKGMPWAFQNGLFCSTFYHFYKHDTDGMIGTNLRSVVKPFAVKIMTALGASDEEANDDTLFASSFVGFFMIFLSILQLPELLGGACSPFNAIGGMLGIGCKSSKKNKPNIKNGSSNGAKGGGSQSKTKKSKKKTN